MSKRGLGNNPFKADSTISIFSPTELAPVEREHSITVNISSIQLPTQQPRRYFDPEKLQQLTESIRTHGILEPLLVRPISDNSYELVAGERRYRAAKEIGLLEVPAVVREMTAVQAMELALIENLQREDLNPVEETEGIINLLANKLDIPSTEVSQLLHRLAKRGSNNVVGNEETLLIVESVFRIVGKMSWESFASHRLPLLNLPTPILEALRAGRIEYTKARALARIQDLDVLKELLNQAIAEKWSLSQIRAAIQEKTQSSQPKEISLKQQFAEVSKTLKSSTIWEDPEKRQQIQQLIDELQKLAKNITDK
ncbi:chromosome partitioning protein ParB [Scytonema hofmannii PCC 7110]|uniref:Chromosome partitioning protein ParB n=1 Tax=Scytonema hofmannii PCC 7110 TaxID=128403 RepID=A0A139WR48_9CYAN|nr:ParB/RepB/Spo0J family partition protein [Scytonema hofmannii]KYC34915.1 chromosome partitioning protein ParB [Scytonema hofmannii PCC 7110]